jgi:hypothetical protein
MAETLKSKTPEKLKRLTDTSKYDDISLLLLCSELPLSPQENDQLITNISTASLLSTSFEGLFKYINLQKQQ